MKNMHKAWLACPGMPEELLSQLQAMNDEEMNDCFYRELAFGTGGLRGVLGAGTNRMNVYTVSKATRGLGQYLVDTFEHPSCAVSYDSRIHSEDFARLAAATLADMGIAVHLYPTLAPTPMLSYAVRALGCCAGVMITASHNPAKFNGYKVYGPDGCQITIEAANTIQACINAQPTLVDSLPCFDKYLAAGTIRYIDQSVVESYYQVIDGLRVAPCDEKLHVVYSPLNGTGNVPVREMLHRMGNVQVDVVPQQEMPDGHFPTCPYPNPEIRAAMALAIEKTIEVQADFCFATDPDCDRIGAGVRVGDQVELISGNDMGVLLLDYVCSHRKAGELPGVAVKTIVTTEMAVPICRHYGVELRNVLTGFKFIGEQIGLLEKEGHAERYVFGFEESYGYLSGTDVRDKDGVNAAVLVCEMAVNLKKHGMTMLDKLAQLRETYGFYAQRLLTYEFEGESGQKKMDSLMAALRAPAEALPDELLRTAERTDYLHDDTGLPASDVMSFLLESGYKIIVRPSGTEPKLKAYLFARGDTQAQAEKELDALESIMNGICNA